MNRIGRTMMVTGAAVADYLGGDMLEDVFAECREEVTGVLDYAGQDQARGTWRVTLEWEPRKEED